MWEQTLSGLIKALRSNKANEKRVIQQALSEIAAEVKSTDLHLKAAAILKLCYLDMLGYPQLSSYSFNVVECMSSNKFHIKQIGYLAASQSFGPNTEVSMLTTNLVKKDLVSHSKQPMYFFNLANDNPTSAAPVLCLALSALPNLLNSQNSADLSSDLISMLNHSKPTIRKRAVTVIHTLARADMLRMMDERSTLGHDPYTIPTDLASRKVMEIWVERFREKLLDDDIGVINSAVSVICELASKCPWPWLELAAELYDLLKLKSNNWMMIKIVKIFTVLTPIEPRLTKKLLPALSELISTTKAMSLLYESIHTVLASGMLTHATSAEESQKLAKICIDKLANFLDHVDQNLRYMALVGLTKLAISHPELLDDYLETILELVHEIDPMLTTQALDLLEGIQYHPHTLQSTVDHLINILQGQKQRQSSEGVEQSDAMRALMSIQLSSKFSRPSPTLTPTHKLRIIAVIISISSKSAYSQIPDFSWFLDILIRLIRLLVSPDFQGSSRDSFSVSINGAHSVTRLANVLIDISSRVREIRPYAVNSLLSLLNDDTFLSHISNEYCSVIDVSGSLSNSIDRDNEGTISASNLVTAAIWICGEYGDEEYVDLKDLISTLFKRQLILDNCIRLPQISTFALHNGLKVFVKWLREMVNRWYSSTGSEHSYDQMQAGDAHESSDDQSHEPSPLDVDLAQLNRLLSAIIDRTQELAKQREIWTSPTFFATIDHIQLLDHANEVAGVMDLIRRELVGFRPSPRPDLSANPQDRALWNESHASMFSGLDEFGEANPFATSPDGPERGFHRAIEGSNLNRARTEAPSEPKHPQPPCWFEILSNLFFIYELKPVAKSAQEMIQPPDELDLDSWIAHLKHTPPRSDSRAELDEYGRPIGEDFPNLYQRNPNRSLLDGGSTETRVGDESGIRRGKKKKGTVDPEGLAKAKRERLERQQADPFYIKTVTKKKKGVKTGGMERTEPEMEPDLLDIDSIPIVKLDLSGSPPDSPAGGPSSSTGLIHDPMRPKTLSKQPSSAGSSASYRPSRPLVIDVEGELPDLRYLKKYNRPSLSSSPSAEPPTPLKAQSDLQHSSDWNTNTVDDSLVVPPPPRTIKVVKKKPPLPSASTVSKKKKKKSPLNQPSK